MFRLKKGTVAAYRVDPKNDPRLILGTDRRCKTIWEQQNTKHDPRMDLDWMNNVV